MSEPPVELSSLGAWFFRPDSRKPLPTQRDWNALLGVLNAIPWEVRWWLLRQAGPLVVNYTDPLPTVPLLAHLAGPYDTVSGIVAPHCWAVRLDLYIGSGHDVVLHEAGHVIDNVGLSTRWEHAPSEPTTILTSTAWWRHLHRSIRWPSVLAERNHVEAFGDWFALGLLAARPIPGHYWGTSPQFDPQIAATFRAFCERRGWGL